MVVEGDLAQRGHRTSCCMVADGGQLPLQLLAPSAALVPAAFDCCCLRRALLTWLAASALVAVVVALAVFGGCCM